MNSALSMLAALGAMAGGGLDGRPCDIPDPRVAQTPDSAQREMDAALLKRQRKADLRTKGAR